MEVNLKFKNSLRSFGKHSHVIGCHNTKWHKLAFDFLCTHKLHAKCTIPLKLCPKKCKSTSPCLHENRSNDMLLPFHKKSPFLSLAFSFIMS